MDRYKLNWLDPESIFKGSYLLSAGELRLLEILGRKQSCFGYSFEKGNYFDNCRFAVLADLPIAARLVHCGRESGWNGTGMCQKWRICSHCAYVRTQKTLRTYLPSYLNRNFAFVTFSFKSALEVCAERDFVQSKGYWESIRKGIKGLFAESRVLGAFWAEEMALLGLCPLRIQAHAHAVFHLEDAAEIKCFEIKGRLTEMLNPRENNPGLVPSIQLRPLRDQLEFAHALMYCTKAIPLKECYEAGIGKGGGSLDNLLCINRNLETFLKGWTRCDPGRHAINMLGTMHPRSKRYLGTLDWVEEDRRQYVDEFFVDAYTIFEKRPPDVSDMGG